MDYKQSAKEFYGHFQDVFQAQVRQTFCQKENLVFVTLQPEKLTCLLPEQIEQLTKETFSELNFLAVYEKTYEKKKRNQSTNLTDNWHAHLITSEKEYKKIEPMISNRNVVAKGVYYLEGLIEYLSKQASRNRLLPKTYRKQEQKQEKAMEKKVKEEKKQIDIGRVVELILGEGKTYVELISMFKVIRKYIILGFRNKIARVLQGIFHLDKEVRLNKIRLSGMRKHLEYLPNFAFHDGYFVKFIKKTGRTYNTLPYLFETIIGEKV